jgi:hypothetical protein
MSQGGYGNYKQEMSICREQGGIRGNDRHKQSKVVKLET